MAAPGHWADQLPWSASLWYRVWRRLLWHRCRQTSADKYADALNSAHIKGVLRAQIPGVGCFYLTAGFIILLFPFKRLHLRSVRIRPSVATLFSSAVKRALKWPRLCRSQMLRTPLEKQTRPVSLTHYWCAPAREPESPGILQNPLLGDFINAIFKIGFRRFLSTNASIPPSSTAALYR